VKKINNIHLPDDDKYFVDVRGRASEGEPEKIQNALSFCGRRRVALDIGAHVGLYTQILSGKFSDVFAVEAYSKNFECLLRNIEGLANVTPYCVAVGAQKGRAVINMDSTREGNSGSHFVTPSATGELSMVTVDSLLLSDVDFIIS